MFGKRAKRRTKTSVREQRSSTALTVFAVPASTHRCSCCGHLSHTDGPGRFTDWQHQAGVRGSARKQADVQ